MNFLTKAVFISTFLSAGFVQAAEPVKANAINIDHLHTAAQNYVAEHIINISNSHIAQLDRLVLTKSNKAKKESKSYVVNNRLVAE